MPPELLQRTASSPAAAGRRRRENGRRLRARAPAWASFSPLAFLSGGPRTGGTTPHSRFKWLLNTGVAIDDSGLTGDTGREALNFNRDTEKC